MLKKLFFYWLPLVIWAVIIFFFSSKPTIKTSDFFWTDFILKKTAHFGEYLIFYLLLFRTVYYQKKVINRYDYIYPLIFVVIYAISDEFHQSFIPGRESRVKDVIIDSTGGFIAICFLKKLLPNLPKKLQILVKA